MEILELLYYSILFFLPAYIANAMPIVANGFKILPSLAKPINKTLFGESKTYRGFVVGVLGAILAVPIQMTFGFFDFYEKENLMIFALLLAFLLGFGALLGDLFKSFIKRRIGIKSGQSWAVFDQIDYVVGGLLLSWLIFPQSIEVILTLLIISPIFSLLANIIAYTLRIKKVWW